MMVRRGGRTLSGLLLMVLFGFSLFGLGLFGWAPPADAHAILIQSSPTPGGSVAGPDVVVTFRYNSRIDKRLSKLTLTRPDKNQTVLDIDPDSPTDSLVSVVRLQPGAYSLRWQVLAIDGHITRGDVPFTVTAP